MIKKLTRFLQNGLYREKYRKDIDFKLVELSDLTFLDSQNKKYLFSPYSGGVFWGPCDSVWNVFDSHSFSTGEMIKKGITFLVDGNLNIDGDRIDSVFRFYFNSDSRKFFDIFRKNILIDANGGFYAIIILLRKDRAWRTIGANKVISIPTGLLADSKKISNSIKRGYDKFRDLQMDAKELILFEEQ